jgi:hypothetical protein
LQRQVRVAQVKGEEGDPLPAALANQKQRAASRLHQRPRPGRVHRLRLADGDVAPIHKLQQRRIGQTDGHRIGKEAGDAEQIAAAPGGRVDDQQIPLRQRVGQRHAIEDVQIKGSCVKSLSGPGFVGVHTGQHAVDLLQEEVAFRDQQGAVGHAALMDGVGHVVEGQMVVGVAGETGFDGRRALRQRPGEIGAAPGGHGQTARIVQLAVEVEAEQRLAVNQAVIDDAGE